MLGLAFLFSIVPTFHSSSKPITDYRPLFTMQLPSWLCAFVRESLQQHAPRGARDVSTPLAGLPKTSGRFAVHAVGGISAFDGIHAGGGISAFDGIHAGGGTSQASTGAAPTLQLLSFTNDKQCRLWLLFYSFTPCSFLCAAAANAAERRFYNQHRRKDCGAQR